MTDHPYMQNLLKKASIPPSSPPPVPPETPVKREPVHHTPSRRAKLQEVRLEKSTPQLQKWQKYLLYVPFGLLGVIGWAILFFIFWRIEPSFMKDFLVPNSYFFVAFLLFLATTFLMSYLLLNLRRGALVGGTVAVVFLLKVHQIFSFPFLGVFIFLPFLVELVLTQLKRNR